MQPRYRIILLPLLALGLLGNSVVESKENDSLCLFGTMAIRARSPESVCIS